MTAVHRQARELGRAADCALNEHVALARVEGQRLRPGGRRVHRIEEEDGPVHGVVVRVGIHRHVRVQVHRAAEADVAFVAVVGRAVEVGVRARDGDIARHRNRVQVDLPAGHRQARELVRAADRATQVHRAGVRIEGQRLRPGGRRVDRRGEGDVAVRGVAVLVAVHAHVGMQVDRAGEGDVAVVAPIGRAVEVDVRARHGNRAHRRHRVQVDLGAAHRQAGELRRAADRALQVHRPVVRIEGQSLAAVDGAGEGDIAVGGIAVLVAVHAHVDGQIDRAGEGDVAVVAPIGRAVEVDVRARHGEHPGHGHRVQIDLPAVHRQAGGLRRAAHRATQVHRTRAARHRQGAGPVDRRAERNVATARTAAHRHRGAVVQVHRPGEGDVAALAVVARRVQVDVRALDADRAGGRHRVEVDLAAVDCQARQSGRAAHRATQVHRPRVRIQRQRIAAVDRRGEGDAAINPVVVGVRVDPDVGGQNDGTAERNRGVVHQDVALQRDRAVRRRQRQRAAQRDRRQGDVVGSDGEVVQLPRAPDRALKVHVAGVRIEGQRLRPGSRRVDRRGEGDVAVGVVGVLVAVDAHVGVQVDRAGEGDVAVVAVIGRAVEVDIVACHGDGSARRYRGQINLSAGNRQTRQLGRAADRALKVNRSAEIRSPGVQRQRISPVDRRGERDVAAGVGIGTVAVHRNVGVQIHRAGEGDVAALAAVGRAVEVNVRPLDADPVGGRHRGEVDLTAAHCQKVWFCRAAHRPLQVHRARARVEGQLPT